MTQRYDTYKEIECIKEYKQRLISDVVTGQIKVCLFLKYICLFIMLFVVISDAKLHFFDDISKENQHFFDDKL